MYRLRCGIVVHPRMADLRAERPVRRARTDEAGSGTQPPPIPYQPTAASPIIQTTTKGRNEMRNISKMTTLENKFTRLAVEHGSLVSKDADLTVAYEVELPELYTVTGAEYEAIHGCWCKAIKVLPDYSIVHKQDWFIKEQYKPELHTDDMSFLSRSFERHFNERPYLKHTCYLYLTTTTKERNRMQSNFSTLCRGHIIPKELDRETAEKFMEATEQFARIMNDRSE